MSRISAGLQAVVLALVGVVGVALTGVQAQGANPFNMCPDLAKLSSHLRTYPYLAWR